MEAGALRCRGAGCAASKASDDAAADGPLAPRTLAETAALSIQDLSVDETASTALEELRPLDDELVAVLQQADIRLVRSTWLRARPDGYILQNRQELEALEDAARAEDGTLSKEDSPLLSPDEAAELIRRGDRSAAILSQGWLKGGHCDPCGARVAVVVKALAQYPYLEALFWDYASLYQSNATTTRNEAQYAAFKRGLKVMGHLYASAVGTTVLQHKEIPPRPVQYDGRLCLREIRVDEAAIRKALEAFGEIVSCEVDAEGDGTIVRFATHGTEQGLITLPQLCPSLSSTSLRTSSLVPHPCS